MDRRALPLLLCLLAATTAYTAGYLGNEDFWWYLASGDVILAQGEVPSRDPFLYTSGNQATWVTSGAVQPTWVTHSWLWTVLLAGLDRIAGLPGIALFSALCVAVIAVLTFTRARLDRFGLVNAALTAFALAAAASRFTPRTDLASCLLAVVTLAVLDRRTPLRWGTLALLVALQWLWSNLHGGYPLGLFLAFAFGVGDWLQRARLRSATLLALGPLFCAASLATPGLGLERLRSALDVATTLGASGAGAAANPLVEWQPTYASGLDASAWTHAIACALAVLSFALARRPWRLARVLVFAGAALLGASANRFVAVFALMTVPLVLANLGELRPALVERLAAMRHPVWRALHITASAALALLLLATAVALWRSRDALDGDPARSGFAAVRPEFSAPGAVAYLREHQVPGPIFNEIGIGGYLIDALYPDQRLFIDTRNLSASLLERYQAAVSSREGWVELQRHYPFSSAVLSNLTFTPMRLRRLLMSDRSWRLAYFDPQASVFVRTDLDVHPPEQFDPWGRWGTGRAPFLPPSGLPPQGALHRYGLSLVLEYLRALADFQQPERIEEIANAALAESSGNPDLLAFRAYARLRLGRPQEAAEDYAEVVRHRPDDFTAQLNYARALSRSGRRGLALDALDAAAALDPENPGIAQLRARIGSRGVAPR